MFVKDNHVYADAGKYLFNKSNNSISLQDIGDITDFEERDLVLTKESIEVKDKSIYWNSKRFILTVPILDKDHIKAYMVRFRYSPDDQLAIILNKDNCDKCLVFFNKMQEWRKFAGEFADLVMSVINNK